MRESGGWDMEPLGNKYSSTRGRDGLLLVGDLRG